MPSTRRNLPRVREVLGHVGANVHRIRQRAGLSQAQLSEEAGLELRHLQRIEAGTGRPSIAAVVLLADALEVPVGRLFRPAKAPERKTGRPRPR